MMTVPWMMTTALIPGVPLLSASQLSALGSQLRALSCAQLSRPSPAPPLTRLQPSAQCRAESHPGHLPVHQKVAAIRFSD